MSSAVSDIEVVCRACDAPLSAERVTCAACLAPQHEACFAARGGCVRCGDQRLLRRPRDVDAWKVASADRPPPREEVLSAPPVAHAPSFLASVQRVATIALAIAGGAVALAFALVVAIVGALVLLIARLFGAGNVRASTFQVHFPRRD